MPSQTQHDLLFQIQHDLEANGHQLFFCAKCQVELRHQVGRIARLIRANPADAWIVVAGSRPALEWFAIQETPCLALYGRTGGLALARTGPEKVATLLEATRCLLELGHRRIVLINRATRRKPEPGTIEVAFLAELGAHGIPTGRCARNDKRREAVGSEAAFSKSHGFQRGPPGARSRGSHPLSARSPLFRVY